MLNSNFALINALIMLFPVLAIFLWIFTIFPNMTSNNFCEILLSFVANLINRKNKLYMIIRQRDFRHKSNRETRSQSVIVTSVISERRCTVTHKLSCAILLSMDLFFTGLSLLSWDDHHFHSSNIHKLKNILSSWWDFNKSSTWYLFLSVYSKSKEGPYKLTLV